MAVDTELPGSVVEYEFVPHTKVLKLIKNNETRWNSTYAMIGRILTLRECVKRYLLQANRDRSIADKLKDCNLTDNDFEDLECIFKILAPVKDATLSLEHSL